jgi:RNA polymerase-binding transcription factor DksA
MAKSEREYLLELRDRNICPNCGKDIPASTRVAYGPGAFCNLDCVAEYNKQELFERARKIQELADRHRNS